EIDRASEAIASRSGAAGVRRSAVRERLENLEPGDFGRGDYARRRRLQDEKLDLPPLPTTTIGSFPQTAAVRSARAKLRRGQLSDDEYRAAMRAEIARVVDLQTEIGL